jgi:branched-subunit amino acid aminotransferase/4-amino-4-deoxychorismate lyase
MIQPGNSRIAWFNGQFMPENRVLISFRDRSWRYGDGVFDMTRTFHGRPFRLKEHIDRFYRSLRYLRLDPGISPQEMIDISERLVTCNEHLRPAIGGSASESVEASIRSVMKCPSISAQTWLWNAHHCRLRLARASSATASTYGRPRSVASPRICSARAPRRTII